MTVPSVNPAFQQTSQAFQQAPVPLDDSDAKQHSFVRVEYTSVRVEHTSLTYSFGPEKTGGFDGEDERTDAANTILNFIAGRLRADVAEGASDEDLATRLEAGLDGFVSGYRDAYEQIAGMDFLNGDVEDAIEQTYSDVLAGVDDLAEAFAVESPVSSELRDAQTSRRDAFNTADVEAPKASEPRRSDNDNGVAKVGSTTPPPAPNAPSNLGQLLEATSFDYRSAESRSFSFSLKTQDGDTVVIRAASASSSVLQGQSARYGGSEANAVAGSFRAASGFYLDIRGEIDEGELYAIEDLLAQIKEVSDVFFAGDVQKAYEYALEVGFDSEEIAMFSLNLRYQSTTQVQETYEQYRKPTLVDMVGSKAVSLEEARYNVLARFIEALEDMRVQADKLGLSGFAQLAEPAAGEKTEATGLLQTLLTRLEELGQRGADQA